MSYSRSFTHMVMHNSETLHVHTNTIEMLWSHAKRIFKAMLGTSKANFGSFTSEFFFCRMTKKDASPYRIDDAGGL